VALGIALSAASAHAQGPASDPRPEVGTERHREDEREPSGEEKARLVEAVDRVEARFRSTLDFADLYDEAFSPQAARLAFVDDDTDRFPAGSGVDEAALARAHIALLNALWLGTAVSLQAGAETTGSGWDPAADTEIREALRGAPYLCDFTTFNRWSDGWRTRDVATIRTRAQLERFVRQADRVSAALRKHFPAEPVVWASVSADPPDPENDSPWFGKERPPQELGLDLDVPTLAIARGPFLYVFVERDGELELLAATLTD
jgi:hypothetical protein